MYSIYIYTHTFILCHGLSLPPYCVYTEWIIALYTFPNSCYLPLVHIQKCAVNRVYVCLCVCAQMELCINRVAFYSNSFWQSCPTQEKTCLPLFLRRHETQNQNMHMNDSWDDWKQYQKQGLAHGDCVSPCFWYIFLTQTQLGMKRQQIALPVKSCLSGITNSLLSKTVSVISRTWLFFPFAFLNLLNVSACTAVWGDIGILTQCSHVELGREDTDSLGKNSLGRFQFVKLSPLNESSASSTLVFCYNLFLSCKRSVYPNYKKNCFSLTSSSILPCR